jgi:alkaline phosphatase D
VNVDVTADPTLIKASNRGVTMRMRRILSAGACFLISAQAFGQNPVAPTGKHLPESEKQISVLTFGSDLTNKPKPILASIAEERPDLFVLLGDAVFSDETKQAPDLPGLRTAYQTLSNDPEFATFRASVPMVVTWDDHDYGSNDGGGDFIYKDVSQKMFDHFWGLEQRHEGHEGVYDAYTFGPPGQRIQIILLDTRYDRSPLTRLSVEKGDGRYKPSENPDQRMLSERQWQWLAEVLRQPADLRVVVSSIQVLSDAHHWERWGNLPLQQEKLFRIIRDSHADGVVLVSGDRVLGALYRKDSLLAYPVYELTTCSLNLPWKNLSGKDESPEMASGQIGPMYPKPNYGEIRVDWTAQTITMVLKDEKGKAIRDQRIALGSLKAR